MDDSTDTPIVLRYPDTARLAMCAPCTASLRKAPRSAFPLSFRAVGNDLKGFHPRCSRICRIVRSPAETDTYRTRIPRGRVAALQAEPAKLVSVSSEDIAFGGIGYHDSRLRRALDWAAGIEPIWQPLTWHGL
jgi:hypothetical protein